MADITIAAMATKATPTTSDLIELADVTAANGAKKATLGSLPISTAVATALAGKAAASHQHAAADIISGTIPVTQIGTGTKDTTTFYRGDGTFAVPDGVTTPAWWSALTLGSGANSGQIAANTTAIQAQINAAAATTMTGMKFQTSGGVYQAGATAPGGGEVRLPPGVIVVTNLVLGHRVALVGSGWGTVLYQANASAGPVVTNRRDGSVHAAYCQVRDLTIHGNADNQSTANHGIHWQGDTTFTYNSTLDEDWDLHCLAQNVQIIRCKGSGIYMTGSGENQARGIFIRSCDGIGLHLVGFDSWVSDFSVAHSGLQGVKVDGDSNRLSHGKVWYSGRITPASGHGYHLTFDTGELSNLEAQDNTGSGFLFDFAHNIAGAALKADSNSRNSAGTYPGFDFYNCGFLALSGLSASNRYNASGPTSNSSQPQTTGYRHRASDGINDIVGTAGTGVWGSVLKWSADSVPSSGNVRINNTVLT